MNLMGVEAVRFGAKKVEYGHEWVWTEGDSNSPFDRSHWRNQKNKYVCIKVIPPDGRYDIWLVVVGESDYKQFDGLHAEREAFSAASRFVK